MISTPENLKIEIFTPNYAVLTWSPVEDSTRYEVRLSQQSNGPSKEDLLLSDTSIRADWDNTIGSNQMCNKYKSEQDDIICYETNQIDPGIQYTFRVQALRPFFIFITNSITVQSFSKHQQCLSRCTVQTQLILSRQL